MEFCELRQVLLGDICVIEYYDGLSETRIIYEGEVDDIGDEFDDLIVCSVEPSSLTRVNIYVEAINDGDSEDCMEDFLDDDDFEEFCKEIESLEEQFDRLMKEEE